MKSVNSPTWGVEQSTVFSATIKGTEKQGSLSSPAEFMPRLVHEEESTAKCEDFDFGTQFVRTVRASRFHSDNTLQSPSTPYLRSRVVGSSLFNSNEKRDLIVGSEVQNTTVTQHIRVLRRKRIEMDQSACSAGSQSAAAICSQQASSESPSVRVKVTEWSMIAELK